MRRVTALEDAVETEQDSPGVSRGQNQLHVLPEDWRAAEAIVEPLLDRVQPDTAGAQLLVLTSDGESAASIAARIEPAATRAGLRLLAVTDAARALRLQRAAAAQVIVGPPTKLVELVQATALKLDATRAVVFAWLELDEKATGALESLMSETPKDAARVVIAGEVSPAVEQLVERHARRARRVQSVAGEQRGPASLSYVTSADSARPEALRRILDTLDPESAFIVARDDRTRTSVAASLRALGYSPESGPIRVGEAPDGVAQLVVLYDMPAGEDDVRRLVAERASSRVVAIVTPRQIPSLRRLAGGSVTPLALPDAASRARSSEERMRDELRQVLASGQVSRELLALEPLLTDYDGAEVAAAALRLLEAERARAQSPAAAPAVQSMTRLFINVGSTDNVRPGDLVGAITNEAGISKTEVGRVDVRDRHSTVEVATPVANSVISKLTGVSIRGRRVLARVDEERRNFRERRDRGDRGDAPRRDRGDRGDRDNARGRTRR
jgi:ATP-dependent RNA helicase DeaD